MGSDIFRFDSGFGNDVVADFTKGKDKLDFTVFGIAWSDLTLETVSSDVIVRVTGIEDTVLIRNVATAGIGSSDFLFA
jgi:hypothetical protein